MIGKQVLTISGADFLKGASTSDYATDGGFSPRSTGINLTYKAGAVYPFPTAGEASSNVVSNIIASCPDNGSSTTVANNRYFVDDAANYYSISGTTVTKQKTGTATTKYTYGITDMVGYVNKYFVTLADDIAMWNGTSTLDETWWTVTQGQSGWYSTSAPHPLLVYKSLLWIADGQYLHTWDGTTSSHDVLDLGSGQVIYALGIDPSSGNMIISSQIGVNGSITKSSQKYLWLYDGFSLTPSRKMVTSDLVTSFVTVAGVVYVGMGQYIGYWNGSGVQTIRKLSKVTYDSAFLPFKNHLAGIGNTLYYIDGDTVFALGPVSQSLTYPTKVAYPVYTYGAFFLSTGSLGVIFDMGGGTVGIFCKTTVSPTYLLQLLDTTNTGSQGVFFLTNRYEFPRPVIVHKIRVFTTGVTTTNSGQVTIYNDENDNSITSTTSSFVVTSGTQYVFDFNFAAKLQMGQFSVSMPSVAGVGFVRAVIYYDVVE